MSDWYKDTHLSTCLHLHIAIESSGSMQFVAGEVVDTVQEQIRCLDCLEILTEEEVRFAWLGEAHFIEVPITEDSHGND